MYSNTLELTGMGLVAVGVAMLLGAAAGLICGGTMLVFVGAATDDAQVALTIRHAAGWVRFRWHRRILTETLQAQGSPHPPLRIDPQAKTLADQMARARMERSRAGDRTAALSRHEEVA